MPARRRHPHGRDIRGSHLHVTFVKPTLGCLAGATAVVVALITLPMYSEAQRTGAVTDTAWTLGALGSPVMAGLVLLALVLMAVGSVVAA